MGAKKEAKYDLRMRYRKALELSTIGALLIVIFFFQAFRSDLQWSLKIEPAKIEIKVEEIPPTRQILHRPVPMRPAVPIPTESEEIPETETIESTELDLSQIPPPPPPESSIEEEVPLFVPYDEPPVIIGGMAALKKVLKYPDIARKAGLEGKVIISVLVDEKGNSVKARVMQSSAKGIGFETAAINAVMKMKWKPAYQRDKPVKVWISIPVTFRLTEHAT